MNIKTMDEADLRTLHAAIQIELNNRDPRIIAQRKQMAAIQAEDEKENQLHEEKMERIVRYLKAVVKPGMRLKMKGCKDGKGLREFIKWGENDNLVCWQIFVSRRWSPSSNKFSHSETNTNAVTTHMADKVQMVQLHDQLIPISKLISQHASRRLSPKR